MATIDKTSTQELTVTWYIPTMPDHSIPPVSSYAPNDQLSNLIGKKVLAQYGLGEITGKAGDKLLITYQYSRNWHRRHPELAALRVNPHDRSVTVQEDPDGVYVINMEGDPHE